MSPGAAVIIRCNVCGEAVEDTRDEGLYGVAACACERRVIVPEPTSLERETVTRAIADAWLERLGPVVSIEAARTLATGLLDEINDPEPLPPVIMAIHVLDHRRRLFGLVLTDGERDELALAASRAWVRWRVDR